jgi:hypothetical protein
MFGFGPRKLAAYQVIHLPDWFTMGGIDAARLTFDQASF